MRGLLCQQCNLGLGCFKDNPTILMNAIEYLSKATQIIKLQEALNLAKSIIKSLRQENARLQDELKASSEIGFDNPSLYDQEDFKG